MREVLVVRIERERIRKCLGNTRTQLAGGGTHAGALSIPTRYIHSGVETCDLFDVEACTKLAVAFVKSEPTA